MMDVQQFYDADPQRRQSEEVEFGDNWTGADGSNYLLSWVHDTGDLYLMRDMVEWGVRFFTPMGAHALPDAVIILAKIEERDRLDAMLSGWALEMDRAGSVTWLCSKLSDAGALAPDARIELDAAAVLPAPDSRIELATDDPESPIADVGPTSGARFRLKRLLGRS